MIKEIQHFEQATISVYIVDFIICRCRRRATTPSGKHRVRRVLWCFTENIPFLMLSVFDIRIDTSSIDTSVSHVALAEHENHIEHPLTAIEPIEYSNIVSVVVLMSMRKLNIWCSPSYTLYCVFSRFPLTINTKTDWQYNRFYRK